MAVLYITSNGNGAGKTTLAITLAQILRQEGKKVTIFKPLTLNNLANGGDPDVAAYHRLLGQTLGDWPIATSKEQLSNKEVLDRITQAYRGLPADQDLIIVEGVSGLDVKASGDIAEALDARAVVVAGYRADLKADELAQTKELFGDRLIGVVMNGLTRYMGDIARASLLPSLESQGIKVLGVIPEDRRLLGITVGQIAEHLNGRLVLWEQKVDELVEHFLIGGFILDWGVLYFGQYENKAVIIRADRPDIQMSALQTSASCFVLTGGKEPIEYVLYEAEQEEVPVILVDTDTHATAAALETLMEKARFDHPLKLERFQELLQENLDLQALYAELGL